MLSGGGNDVGFGDQMAAHLSPMAKGQLRLTVVPEPAKTGEYLSHIVTMAKPRESRLENVE